MVDASSSSFLLGLIFDSGFVPTRNTELTLLVEDVGVAFSADPLGLWLSFGTIRTSVVVLGGARLVTEFLLPYLSDLGTVRNFDDGITPTTLVRIFVVSI